MALPLRGGERPALAQGGGDDLLDSLAPVAWCERAPQRARHQREVPGTQSLGKLWHRRESDVGEAPWSGRGPPEGHARQTARDHHIDRRQDVTVLHSNDQCREGADRAMPGEQRTRPPELLTTSRG